MPTDYNNIVAERPVHQRILLWTCPAALFHLGPPGKIYPNKKLWRLLNVLGKTAVEKKTNNLILKRYLFELCDHPEYNHLSHFGRAPKKCFNSPELQWISALYKQWRKRKVNLINHELKKTLPEICFGPPPLLLQLMVGWRAHVDVFAVKQELYKDIQPMYMQKEIHHK